MPPPRDNLTLPATNVAHYITAGDLDEEHVRVHTSAFTPQLRALFAECGQGDSCLND